MDPAFVPIYQELTLEFDPGFQLRRPRARREYALADRIALNAVDTALRELTTPVRADARLMLVSNLSIMALRPLLHPASPRAPEKLPEGELEAAARADARLVLQVAAKMDGRQITAATVLRATAQSLEQLRLKEWRLWDRIE